MIITCKKQVPFRWIAFAILPWASATIKATVLGGIVFFSLRKFIDNPAGLTFVLSLPGFVSLVMQPVVSFISDRIWTRVGRRKPFVLASMIGGATTLILLPLMPNFWGLLAVYLIHNAVSDLGSPLEPLKLEIIPPHERGRAMGATAWLSNLATMTFYFIALGRFDDVTYMAGVPLRGETVIYWSTALLLITMTLLIALGIREIDQKSALRGERLSPRSFFGGLLDPELWPVYMLVVGSACLDFYSGLGALSNLLYTEQWGYTKQEMGINVAVGGIINIFVIGLLTIFADRLNRMRTYQTLICLSLIIQVLYYCYVNFVLPDQRPTLVEIIVFGETLSILGILTGLVYTPLVYDYIQRNKMGTFNAGGQVVRCLTTLVTLNGVGLFVWGYAVFFQPPAGEMTRIVLHGDQNTQAEVLASLRANTWTLPSNGSPAPASSLAASAWRSDGTVNDTGRCWEIRLRDSDSERLAEERESLNAENSPLLGEEKMLRDNITVLKGKGEDVAAKENKADEEQGHINAINAKIAAISEKLDARAKNFHDQVAKVLGNRIISEGEEILGSSQFRAMLLDLPATRHPDTRLLDTIIARFRHDYPSAIDLRPLKLDHGYGIEVSAMYPEGSEPTAFARKLEATTTRVANTINPGLLDPAAAPLGHTINDAVTAQLMILEDPLPTYISPITRIVDVVLGLFGDGPDPRRRLDAISRNLRSPGEIEHVRIEPGSTPKSLAVTLVFPDSFFGPHIGQKVDLPALAKKAVEPQTKLLSRIELAAATQRITLARPTLATTYAPMKYDYMSGYLWMFGMGSIGILITIAFTRIEARGIIRKRGIEEEQQS